jgi:hypothetical protein
MPMMGKRKTTRHQRTLFNGGRFDLRTSTVKSLLALNTVGQGTGRCKICFYNWKAKAIGGNVLKTMMSRIKTTKPIIPPLEPYFHAFPCPVVVRVSEAAASAKREAWRSMLMRVLKAMFVGWVSLSEMIPNSLVGVCSFRKWEEGSSFR